MDLRASISSESTFVRQSKEGKQLTNLLIPSSPWHTAITMKIFATILAGVGLVAAHGYVDNATIGGQFYQVRLMESSL